MQLNPYLYFNGNCKEAFHFYQTIFGGEDLVLMTHAQTPMADKTAPEWRDKIIHARMKIGNISLMASDAPPDHFHKPQGFSVSVMVKETAEAKRIFDALAKGGHVHMPLEKTFWSDAFGMLTDQFGTPWMINQEKPM